MNSIEKLNKKFIEIKSKGYIISKYKDLGYAGKTFENQLGKRLNKFQTADFEDIEIKVKNEKSKYPISLFSISPQIKNKEYVNADEYLFKNFAISNAKNEKIFYCEINGKRYSKSNGGIFFKIKVDYENKKLLLKIADGIYGIENDIYWLFNGIEKRLQRKMKKLAIVDVDVKNENNNRLCYYHNINYYQLKEPTTFFKLIEEGKIIIAINIKLKNGKIKSDGMKFRIKHENILELFDKINLMNE